MALVCTHCGVATAFTPVEIRLDEVELGESYTIEQAVFEGSKYRPNLAVIACQNCNKLFIAEKAASKQWQSVWPLSTRSLPQDIPEPVRSTFQEALLCLAAGALGGCVMMCRTTLERTLRDQGLKASNLNEGLKVLKQKGVISQKLYSQADEVRLWGNMVAHKDFDQKTLGPQTCEELVVYIDSLLDAVYVQDAKLAKHAALRKQATSSTE